MAIGIPLLVALIGGVTYLASTKNPKIAQLGLYTFLAGMIGFCIQVSGQSLSFLK